MTEATATILFKEWMFPCWARCTWMRLTVDSRLPSGVSETWSWHCHYHFESFRSPRRKIGLTVCSLWLSLVVGFSQGSDSLIMSAMEKWASNGINWTVSQFHWFSLNYHFFFQFTQVWSTPLTFKNLYYLPQIVYWVKGQFFYLFIYSWIHRLIHPFSTYSLSICCQPGTILCTGLNQWFKLSPCLYGVYVLRETDR